MVRLLASLVKKMLAHVHERAFFLLDTANTFTADDLRHDHVILTVSNT